MKTKKSDEFVKRALGLPRAKFAVVGKGTQWTIYEGTDLAKATADGDDMLIKCSCQSNKKTLSVVARGGPAEIVALKKVFGAQLHADPKSLTFRAISDKDDEELEKLVAELAGPVVEQIARLPDTQRDAVTLLHQQVEALAAEGDLAGARAKLAELTAKLPGAKGPEGKVVSKHEKDGSGSVPPGKTPTKPHDDPAAEWKAKLANWTPVLKEAMAAKGPHAADIAKLLHLATDLSHAGDMVQALAKLNEAQWLARRQTIDDSYLKALKAHPDKAGQLRAVLAYADGKAEAKDFGAALQALDGLDKALHAPSDAPPPASGLVKKRKFLLERWQRIPEEIYADLQVLQQAIGHEMPDEDANGLIDLAEDYLDDFYTEMKEAIDDDINAGDAQYKKAIGTIGAFRSKIAVEPLIQHLKTNKMKVKLSVESILLNALAEVEQALAR